jgi:hypothetical protein
MDLYMHYDCLLARNQYLSNFLFVQNLVNFLELVKFLRLPSYKLFEVFLVVHLCYHLFVDF